MIVAAIRPLTAAIALFVVVSLLGLWGFWLVILGSARRSLVMQRGGMDLRRRPRLDERIDERLLRTRRG
ncbi:MAG: hypothetical protein JO304_19540, partial [Solirubrobacterales bacterium]|nr:hypothetical protein [Solirubrobacterales bacterium]